MKARIIAVLAAIFVFAGSYAFAGTAVSNINVSANVLGQCTILATALTFPNYASGGSVAATTSSTIDVTCASGVPYTVSANGGGSGIPSGRVLRDITVTSFLNYNIYTDIGYTTIFGDGTGGTITMSSTGTGTLQSTTIYGKIPSLQTPILVGAHTDTVVATVSW